MLWLILLPLLLLFGNTNDRDCDPRGLAVVTTFVVVAAAAVTAAAKVGCGDDNNGG